jgi:hypothetical protein
MAGVETELKIIREIAGRGTGDRLLQTEDSRWWERWDGIVKTGEEVRTKTNGHLK